MTWTPIALGDFLASLPVRRRTMRFRACGDLAIPAFSGALWHAVLGPALRAEACRASTTVCDRACAQPAACAFGLVVQGGGRGAAEAPLALVTRPPGPLVFDTAPWSAQCLKRGDIFHITFTVVGGATLAEAVARALERAARHGLGRSRIAAEYVGSVETAGLAELASPYPGPSVRLRFLTPLRLKRDRTYARDLDVRALARDVAFRIAALGHYHAGQPWPAPWPEVASEAAAVHVERSATRWVEAARYSARQNRRVVLGGIVGEADLGGVGPGLGRLLAAGTVLHAGKGSSMGLGQFTIEPPGARAVRPAVEDEHALARG